jgi:hypothetical protein
MTRGAKERCGRCEGSGWLSPDECMYGPLARCPKCRPDDPTIVRVGQVWESGGQRITVVEVHDGGVRGVGFDPLGNRWYVGDEYPSWRLVTEPCAELYETGPTPWKVGDRAIWDGVPYIVCGVEQNWEAPDQAALVRKEAAPDQGARGVLLWQLKRPVKQKVTVQEYRFEGRTCWTTDNPYTPCWKPTGRTHEFEVGDED